MFLHISLHTLHHEYQTGTEYSRPSTYLHETKFHQVIAAAFVHCMNFAVIYLVCIYSVCRTSKRCLALHRRERRVNRAAVYSDRRRSNLSSEEAAAYSAKSSSFEKPIPDNSVEFVQRDRFNFLSSPNLLVQKANDGASNMRDFLFYTAIRIHRDGVSAFCTEIESARDLLL